MGGEGTGGEKPGRGGLTNAANRTKRGVGGTKLLNKKKRKRTTEPGARPSARRGKGGGGGGKKGTSLNGSKKRTKTCPFRL